MSAVHNEIEFEVTDTGNVRMTLIERTSFGVVSRKQFSVRRHRFERALDAAEVIVPWKATRTSPTICECGHRATEHYSHGGCGCEESLVRCACLNFTPRAILVEGHGS